MVATLYVVDGFTSFGRRLFPQLIVFTYGAVAFLRT